MANTLEAYDNDLVDRFIGFFNQEIDNCTITDLDLLRFVSEIGADEHIGRFCLD